MLVVSGKVTSQQINNFRQPLLIRTESFVTHSIDDGGILPAGTFGGIPAERKRLRFQGGRDLLGDVQPRSSPTARGDARRN